MMALNEYMTETYIDCETTRYSMASWNNWNLETDRTNNPAESINARINGEFLKKHPKFEKVIAVLKIVQNETDRLLLQKMSFHNFNRQSAEKN